MRKLFFPLATLCLSLLLGACEGKDSTPSNLSAEEGKEVIQTSSKSMSTEMQDMQNHPSFAALESLALLESPVPFLTDFDFSDFEGLADLDTYKKASSTKKQLSFGKKTLKKNDYAPTEEEFDFASAVGTYNWNSTNQNWDISLGSPADKVIVNYPSQDSETNNSSLVVSEYTEKTVTDDDFTYSELVSAKAELTVDGENVMLIDYDNTMDNGKGNIKLLCELPPYALNLNLATQQLASNLSFALTKGSTSLMSTTLNYTLIGSLVDINYKLSGYLQYGNVKLSGNIMMSELDDLNYIPTATVDMYNEAIDLSLYSFPENQKIGDIVFVKEDNYYAMAIQYTDGSTELVKEAMKEFSKDINELLGEDDELEEKPAA